MDTVLVYIVGSRFQRVTYESFTLSTHEIAVPFNGSEIYEACPTWSVSLYLMKHRASAFQGSMNESYMLTESSDGV